MTSFNISSQPSSWQFISHRFLQLILALSLLLTMLMYPADLMAKEWYTSGHLKYYLSHTVYDDDNIFSILGEPNATDQNLNLRLIAEKKWQSKWDAVIHYEAVGYHSDSLNIGSDLESLSALSGYTLPNDDRRLFNLTSVISDSGSNLIQHRLDRASIGYTSNNFVFRFGRQAISWGNGMIFQPMDIFNPFSPTAIDTEYKSGDDLLYLQNLLDSGDDIQTVLIPRRDPATSDLEANESSLAIKYHGRSGDTDFDILLARHINSDIVGVGFASDWKDGILRGDLVSERNSVDTVISAVVSYNYSWIWSNHNMTGFIEYYHNGGGIDDGNYSLEAFAGKPALIDKLSRGEVFTLGQDYVDVGLTIELTPRWIFNSLIIHNINDGGWLTQWTASFDWKQNLVLLLGATLPIADKGTEYGGIPTPLNDVYIGSGRSFFLQLSTYF